MSNDVGLERSPSGTIIYKHTDLHKKYEFSGGDPYLVERVSSHIERSISKVEEVFHEKVSTIVHVDVHKVSPTSKRNFHILITSGMSEMPMTAPKECEGLRYAELLICLPASWPLSAEAFQDEKNYWPVRLLKFLARFPHVFNSWIGYGHTIPNGNPPKPYADNTKMNCALIVPPLSCPADFYTLKLDEDKVIHFYAVVPLYQEEVDFKLQHGLDPLLDLFDKHGVTDLLQVARMNVCTDRMNIYGKNS